MLSDGRFGQQRAASRLQILAEKCLNFFIKTQNFTTEFNNLRDLSQVVFFSKSKVFKTLNNIFPSLCKCLKMPNNAYHTSDNFFTDLELIEL